MSANTTPLDLRPAGLPLVIVAPEGATARDAYGWVNVEAPRFHIRIVEGRADMAIFKENLKDWGTLKGFPVDSADAVVSESLVLGAIQFHFMATVEVAGTRYCCEDYKGQAYNFTRAEVDAMLAACRSLAAKE